MTGLNIRVESYIHEINLFGFSGRSDDVIVINYCILYAKQYVYLEKLKENKNQNRLLGLPFQALIYIKNKKAYTFTIIKIICLICLILYMITYRLNACDILM